MQAKITERSMAIIGKSGVGKSQLISKYSKKTSGFLSKVTSMFISLQREHSPCEKYKLNAYKFKSKDINSKTAANTWADITVVALVFDLSNSDSLEYLDGLMSDIRRTVGTDKNFILVANKVDKMRTISAEQIQSFKSRHALGDDHFEISAKTGPVSQVFQKAASMAFNEPVQFALEREEKLLEEKDNKGEQLTEKKYTLKAYTLKAFTFWRFMRSPLTIGLLALLLLGGIAALVVGTCGFAAAAGGAVGLGLTVGGAVSTGIGGISLGINAYSYWVKRPGATSTQNESDSQYSVSPKDSDQSFSFPEQ